MAPTNYDDQQMLEEVEGQFAVVEDVDVIDEGNSEGDYQQHIDDAITQEMVVEGDNQVENERNGRDTFGQNTRV